MGSYRWKSLKKSFSFHGLGRFAEMCIAFHGQISPSVIFACKANLQEAAAAAVEGGFSLSAGTFR